MYGQRRIFLLTYMVAVAIPISLAFNIDVKNPSVYTGDQKDFFGYKVRQYMYGTTKGIIVTAPLQLNGSGAICIPDRKQTTNCFKPEEIHLTNQTIQVKHVGLSLAMNSKGSEFTACSPSVAHECDGNTYLNSVCYKLTDKLQQISSFKPSFKDCTKKTVDLVFLFDGSGSMTTSEFSKNKYFIVKIMDSLKNSSIKFAAVQFSTNFSKVFDFNDYEAGRALDKLKKEPHLKSLTNTHKALTFVLEEILENTKAGASSDATKVLVLITDGDPSDSDRHGIIKTYNDKSIIRYVIGVKIKNLDKVKTIASEPKDKNAFKIENYDGLTGLLERLQNRIFKVEGSEVAQAGDLTDEMAQSGFFAAFHKDTLILGAVGSNTWRGSLHEYGETNKTIEDPEMLEDSYMGYSVSVGEMNNVTLYFTGAPRFEHKGQVVVFKDGNPIHRLNGSQIGSYFGAELCSLDVDSDGNTDFLLVGAPLFYNSQEKREGQIYIYPLTNEMQQGSELMVIAPSMGRFGTTISSLADLNGDRLRDVAVGAPLEDENKGAVYIYLGDSGEGIRSEFSQRIRAQEFSPQLRFFGQAIDGNIDLGEDGLPDIVVGSRGNAVVLRSRPVFNVIAHLTFKPEEISTEDIDCVSTSDSNLLMVNLTACFEMSETTKSKAVRHGLNISCTFAVDPTRPTTRGFFSETDRKARNLTSTYKLTQGETCYNYSIFMPKCVKDTLSPVSIKLNFSQVDVDSASTVLNTDSKRQAAVEVPFQKECRKNDTCIADLEVDFNFTTPTLLVAEDKSFHVIVNLTNHGDDSYNTSLTMHYPEGLSFSKMTVIQSKRPTLHKCDDLEGVLDKSVCGVSLPVYRSRSYVTFDVSYRIIYDPTLYEWPDTMLMTVIGKSDNSNSTKASMTKSLPVQYAINMAVTVKEETISFMNFTVENAEPKKLVTVFQVNNPGFKEYPVNVSLFFPTKLEHNLEIKNYKVFVQQNKTQCTRFNDKSTKDCSSEEHCKVIECDSFILHKYSHIKFTLSADVEFNDFKQFAMNVGFVKRYTGDHAEVRFKNFLKVSYDDQRYVLDSHKQEGKIKKKSDETGLNDWNDPTEKSAVVRVELIVWPDKQLIILTGVGIGILLLIILTIILFKLGCFKRKEFPYDEQREGETGYPPDQEEANGSTPTDDTEEKGLLDHDGENHITVPDDTNQEGLHVQEEANSSTPTDDTEEKGLLVHNGQNHITVPDDTNQEGLFSPH